MIETPPINTTTSPTRAKESAPIDEAIYEKALQFEAVFISQMLKHSGFTEALGKNAGFGGDAFSGMLTQQYAEQITNEGGFGLAKKIYSQLLNKEAQSESNSAG